MQVQLIAIVVTMFALTACSAGGGDTAPKPGPAKNASGSTTPVPPPVTPEPCVPSAANNNCQPTASIVDQCWAEMFDTAAAKACATAGKMYNRVLKKCVDAGVTLKTGCTAADVPATDLAKALADMSALHPDSNPQLDQCGTYTADSKTYNVYYFMGKSTLEQLMDAVHMKVTLVSYAINRVHLILFVLTRILHSQRRHQWDL